MKDSRIVVTGGAGAIGCNLVKKLLEYEPKEIIVIDNLTSGNKNYLPTADCITFFPTDIFFKDKLEQIIPEDTDYIFHLAAHFANQNSVEFPLSDIQSNVIGTLNLLEISKTLNLKKFINCSSSCVYGNSSLMKIGDSVYPSETPYAINKLSGELYTTFYSHYNNIPTINVRIFNTFGPYELSGKYRNVIPNFIDKALKNQPITITGTGKETRDFTFVEDTCNLLISMALSNVKDGSTYNAGTGVSTDILTLAQTIVKICKSKSKIEFTKRRKWDNVLNRLSDISLTSKVFNYIPNFTNLEANLSKTITWYKSQL
jgi:UDP-glucose 4-epimerase